MQIAKRNFYAVLLAISAFAISPAPTATAQPIELPDPLAEFAGKIWLLSDARPIQYFQYEPEAVDGILTFGGMDNDGNVVGGYFSVDPETGQTTMFSVRNGLVSDFDVSADPAGIALTGEEAGAKVRQTYKRVSSTKYRVDFEEWRGERWVRIREANLVRAFPGAIRALNWIERNPEAEAEAAAARAALMIERPSFLKRLVFAVEDGLVVGVQIGVESGVSEGIHNAIANPDASDDNAAED